jgi:hypothetical protein
MTFPRRGKENSQDYNVRNTPSNFDERNQSELDGSIQEINEPDLDEEDLEENDLEDDDLDDVEWEEPQGEDEEEAEDERDII